MVSDGEGKSAYHEEEPISHFMMLARTGRKADFEVFVVGGDEVFCQVDSGTFLCISAVVRG